MAALSLTLFGCAQNWAVESASGKHSPGSVRHAGPPLGEVVGLRRLTEAQYRNSIADILGPDIVIGGRFEPIVRPAHELIAIGASSSTISPAGLEQFDAMARGIAAQVFDEKHRAMFVKCVPAAPTGPDSTCAAQVLAPIGRYAFRRPLTAAETVAYVKIAGDAATQTGSFYAGLELALAAILVSPNFLYVVESAESDPDHPGDLSLDAYSRASRLSFLLWNTTPNESLLQAAVHGDLDDPVRLQAIAERMVASPRLEAGIRAFFSDMLLFEKFDEIAKDPIIYRRFNQAVAKDLPEQLLRTIVDHLVTQRGDYRELFTTRRTFITRSLGPIYGVPVHASKGWEPLEFGPDSGRAGLLSQAGFLALYSHSGRSSPTLRGRAVRELLLCQPVPNPPGNVNFTVVQDTSNPVLRTARARLTAHSTDPVCAACHRITDPIGLPLETFDGIGAYRRQENGADIDTSGAFDGAEFTGVDGLGKAVANSTSATECVANRTLEYATGRPADGHEAAAATLVKAFATDGYNIPALFLRVATLPDAYRIVRAPTLAGPSAVAMSSFIRSVNGAAR